MSPSIIKYKGFNVVLYPNDHTPAHVHVEVKGGYEVKVIFKLQENKISAIEYEDVKGKKKLTPAMKRDLKKLVNAMKYTMVADFQTHVIERKKIHKVIVIKETL